MKPFQGWTGMAGMVIVSAFATSAAVGAEPLQMNRSKAPQAVVSVYATGLNNPRGLKFGPDGDLYVAEGGLGGTNSTIGLCTQVPTVGPYLGSPTGSRISRIDSHGHRVTVAENFPSSQTNSESGSLVSGVADIAFVDGRLYGILAGAGCSHGVPSMPNGVVRVNKDGSWKLIANLSAFQMAYPTQVIEPDDFEPDGTWYSLVALDDDLYAVEPNHGELDVITTDGRINRIADISASQGHIVPTAMAVHDGDFYVGNLGTFPIVQGASKILRITKRGNVKVVVTGLTIVTGIAFDKRGRMYVLENTVGHAGPTPASGRIVRVTRHGDLKVIASNLMLPTAMTFGRDGNLYVSAAGFGLPPKGLGQVLKVDLRPETDEDDD